MLMAGMDCTKCNMGGSPTKNKVPAKGMKGCC